MYKTIRLLISKHKLGLWYTFGIIIVAALLAPFAVSLLSSILEDTSNFGSDTFVKSILFFILIFLLFNISEEYVDYQKRKMIQILQIDLRLNMVDKLVRGEYSRIKTIHSGDWLYYQTLADEAVFLYFYPIFNAVSLIVTILSASYCILKLDEFLFFSLRILTLSNKSFATSASWVSSTLIHSSLSRNLLFLPESYLFEYTL